MKGDRPLFSTEIIDVVPVVIAILMLAMAFLTLTYDRLFESLIGLAHASVPANSEILYIVAIVSLAAMPLAFLRIWPNELLRAASYLAWLLYLPSALFYSGIDVFRILSISANFSIFSSGLSFTMIAVCGILLACGSLASNSFGRLKTIRENFIERGADKAEVRRTLFYNAMFELKLIIVSGAATIFFALVAPSVGEKLQFIFKPVGFTYLLAGLGAIVLLALVLIISLWPRKNGEKG